MAGEGELRYGVAGAHEIAGLTGRQILQGIIDGRVPHPPICRSLTFWLAQVGDGTAVFEGETGPHLLNPAGTVHGGWLLTLVDSAAGCAAHSLLPAGVGYTTVETKGNFSRPIMAETGRVRCEAEVVNQGRQIITVEAWVKSAAGKLLGHGTSTLLVLGGAA